MVRILRTLILVLSCAFFTHAQDKQPRSSCAQNLRIAQATYESGRLHEVPGFLTSCISSSVVQERVNAYRLLCLTYIYLEEPAKADDAMLNILENFHEFEPSKADPAEFVALWKTFRRDPIYRIGGKLGANVTQPNVISFIPSNDGKSEYQPGITFHGGISFELPLPRLVKGLTFAPELNLMLKNFKYENKVRAFDEAEQEYRDFTTTSTESHIWLSLPITAQYEIFQKQFATKKLRPFIGVGICPELLINAKNKFLRTREGASSLQEETIDVKGQRNALNLSAMVSGGAKLKVTGGFAVFEVKYLYGLTKANGVKDIYSMPDKTFPSGYVDGVFKLNTLVVSVGYVYNVYNPKKLNK